MIEEIMELIIRSADTVSKERLNRKKEAAAAAAAQKQQQNGVDEQLQRMIWDTGRFQQMRWEAHEQELMILQLRSMM